MKNSVYKINGNITVDEALEYADKILQSEKKKGNVYKRGIINRVVNATGLPEKDAKKIFNSSSGNDRDMPA